MVRTLHLVYIEEYCYSVLDIGARLLTNASVKSIGWVQINVINELCCYLQFPTTINPQTLGRKYAGVINGIMLSFMQVRL